MVESNGAAQSSTERADRMVQSLRAKGERITTSRRAVIGLLASTDDHLTVEDIADRVQALHPEIHLSTVYRTLETLEEWGVVEHVHRGHVPPIHHLADAHPHLVCETCGAVADIPVGDARRPHRVPARAVRFRAAPDALRADGHLRPALDHGRAGSGGTS